MKGQQFSPRVALEAGVALFFFGCIAVAVKFISANAITIGIARLAMTVVIMLPALAVTKRLRGITLADLRPLAIMGVFFALHWMSFFFAVKIGSASVATVGLSTYGIHLIVLGWFFHRSKVTALDIVVLALAVLGNILVIPEFSIRNQDVIGLGLSVLSGFFYAFLPILQQRNTHIPAPTRALGQFVFGLAVFLLLWPVSSWDLSPRDWWGLLFLGILCTLLSHTLWVRLTTMLSTKVTSVIYYLYVPVSLVLSVVVLGERVDAGMITGAALIIVANIVGVFHHLNKGSVYA
jgi:drug/metabolite transporter (DMT)-like permease